MILAIQLFNYYVCVGALLEELRTRENTAVEVVNEARSRYVIQTLRIKYKIGIPYNNNSVATVVSFAPSNKQTNKQTDRQTVASDCWSLHTHDI